MHYLMLEFGLWMNSNAWLAPFLLKKAFTTLDGKINIM